MTLLCKNVLTFLVLFRPFHYIQILFHWKKVYVGIQTQESCERCPAKPSGRRWESIGTIVSVNRNSKGANFMTFLIVWPQLWYSSFIEFHSGLIWWMARGPVICFFLHKSTVWCIYRNINDTVNYNLDIWAIIRIGEAC